MARGGNDEIQRLVFEIETRGAAEVEQNFKNVEKGLIAALHRVKDFARSSNDASVSIGDSLKKAVLVASDLEVAIAKSNQKYTSLFSGPKMAEQERKLRGLNRELQELAKVMGGADENMKAAAEERYKTVKSAILFESMETTKLLDKTKKEFDSLMSTEKKSMAELVSQAGAIGGKGAGAGIFGLIMGKGDMESILQDALEGIGKSAQAMSQQAGRRYAEMASSGLELGGAASGGGGQALMGMLTKLGPVVIGLATTVGILLAAFTGIDSKMTDLNRTMLKNVSLVDLASNSYRSAKGSIGDAEEALSSFRHMAAYNADLKNMGLDADGMSAILGQLNESGMLLGNLRQEGIEYEDAIKGAQQAALALGVEGTNTAELMGQMANIARTGFQESLDALTQIVHQARDAGVSTKRFFQVVQSVGGEMGLFNYRIAETASLFGRLSKIMDAQSAQTRTTLAAQKIRDMGVDERLGLMAYAGRGQVTGMLDRSQRSTAETIDFAKMSEALEKMGKGPVSDVASFEAAMANLGKEDRMQLQEVIRSLGHDGVAGSFEKWRRLEEAGRTDFLKMQGELMNLHQSDQRILLRQQIEKTTGKSVFESGAGELEALGFGSSSELNAMLIDLGSLKGRQLRLEAALKEGPAAFELLAKEYGLKITPEQFLAMKDYLHLDDYAVAPESAQTDLENYAKTSAELQRSTLDTLQNELVEMVGDIHRTLIEMHRSLKSFFGTSSDGMERSTRNLQKSDWQKEIRSLQKLQDTATDLEREEIEKKINHLRENLKSYQEIEDYVDRGASYKEAIDMQKRGYTDVDKYKSWIHEMKTSEAMKAYAPKKLAPKPTLMDVTRKKALEQENLARNPVDLSAAMTTQQGLFSPLDTPNAEDARILTRGIPLLNLAPGDIVVHQDALAATMAGGKGQFVPDLMKKAGVPQGGGASMSNTFHIYSGDAQKLKETVLQVLGDWERKRSMS